MVARVQRPAPSFKATAVVDGTFKDICLSDYLGQWFVVFAAGPRKIANFSEQDRPIVLSFVFTRNYKTIDALINTPHPQGLYICLPHVCVLSCYSNCPQIRIIFSEKFLRSMIRSVNSESSILLSLVSPPS